MATKAAVPGSIPLLFPFGLVFLFLFFVVVCVCMNGFGIGFVCLLLLFWFSLGFVYLFLLILFSVGIEPPYCKYACEQKGGREMGTGAWGRQDPFHVHGSSNCLLNNSRS